MGSGDSDSLKECQQMFPRIAQNNFKTFVLKASAAGLRPERGPKQSGGVGNMLDLEPEELGVSPCSEILNLS